MNSEHYDDIIIGGGRAGKNLAPALVADGRKTALVERRLTMIGGSCPNIACVPSKTMVASAAVANTVRNSAAYGIHTVPPTVDMAAVIQRKRSLVQSLRPINLNILNTALEDNLIIGTAHFVAPKTIEFVGAKESLETFVVGIGLSLATKAGRQLGEVHGFYPQQGNEECSNKA